MTDTVTPRTEAIEFSGDGGEYFRIWIVNLALSVVTLGIYSAWAKVRRLRYFYGSTRFDRTGPLGARTKILYKKIECSPCLKRTCKFGHYQCLWNIQITKFPLRV